MEKIIRDASLEDAEDIAKIIMLAFYSDLCNTISNGNGDSGAFDLLKELASLPDSQYSYRNTIICEVDGKTAGGICGYDGGKLHVLRKQLIASLQKRGWRTPDNLTDETKEGEFYLDSLAVYPDFRGMRIASDLIDAATARAARMGFHYAGLLVDIENPEAEKLYTRLGFSRIDTTLFLGHSMYHMQKAL
ncbi:MAG: N-acetyltransferase [Bacteroidales bacterium]